MSDTFQKYPSEMKSITFIFVRGLCVHKKQRNVVHTSLETISFALCFSIALNYSITLAPVMRLPITALPYIYLMNVQCDHDY